MTRQGRQGIGEPWPTGLDGMIERKIAEAYATGLFENLKDAGKPLDLRQNPFQDPTWRLAYHILENAGMAPAWVEERRSIQKALTKLRQAGQEYPSSRPPSAEGSPERLKEIRALNKRIESFNLTVPHPAFRLKPIRL